MLRFDQKTTQFCKAIILQLKRKRIGGIVGKKSMVTIAKALRWALKKKFLLNEYNIAFREDRFLQ